MAHLAASRLWVIFRKEFAAVRNNPGMVLKPAVALTVVLMLVVYLVDSDNDVVRLGIVDESRSEYSRDLNSRYEAALIFEIHTYASAAALNEAIDLAEIDAGIVIPADFAAERGAGRPAQVQVIVDATSPSNGSTVGAYVAGVINDYNRTLTSSSAPPTRRGQIAARVNVLHNSAFVSRWYLFTGLLGILWLANVSQTVGVLVMNEKEQGGLDLWRTTAARPWEILFGRTLTYVVMFLPTACVAPLVAGQLVYGVPMRGSMLDLVLGAALFLICALSIGTLFAVICNSMRQMMMLLLFTTSWQTLMSGAFAPVEALQSWALPLVVFNPLGHWVVIIRGVMLKGVGIETLLPHYLSLLGLGAALFMLSAWLYQKQGR
ncbi:MAG TPA: ABC transporter permease [Pyrinomonadaceae bacterium]|nr:ABC transporter permease [Pyrinomonadaceae bacterium]